jgi:hypothetical protein
MAVQNLQKTLPEAHHVVVAERCFAPFASAWTTTRVSAPCRAFLSHRTRSVPKPERPTLAGPTLAGWDRPLALPAAPYSPDLNPFEQFSAKLKHLIRKAEPRTSVSV